MKGLKTLILMQLKDKIDLSFTKSKKSLIFKIVLSVLKFAIITALIFVAFYLLSVLRLVSILPGIPQNFFVAVFAIMFLLSTIFCTFGLMKSLYFAKDNQVLLVMPVSRTTVFTSKLVVYYIYELIRNLTYFLPLFLAYALINGMPFYFYIWLPISYVVITALPVAIGALLSIPLMFISNFIKQHRILEYILVAVFIAFSVLAIIVIIRAIPDNFDLIGSWGTTFWEIQSVLEKINQIFLPLSWVAEFVVGFRYGVSIQMFGLRQLLIIPCVLVAIVAILGLTFLIVRPLFFKMASTPFEYKREQITKQERNKPTKSFLSMLKKEITIIYRTPSKFYGLLFSAVGLPLAILLLNKLYAAMDTRLLGAYMAVAFNVLLILLIALSSSVNLAHIYSEEGASSYLLRTTPKAYLKSLFSKLIINIVAMTISIAVATGIFVAFMNFSFINAIIIFVIFEAIYLSHLFMSAEYDIMNPQTMQYQTTGGHVNNPNDVKSTVMSLILSALIAFLTYFFIMENAKLVWIKIAFVAVAFLTLRLWLYINKIKVYYKEKQ